MMRYELTNKNWNFGANQNLMIPVNMEEAEEEMGPRSRHLEQALRKSLTSTIKHTR